MEEKEDNTKSDAALREERILKFWEENKVFEKSLTKPAPKGEYVFYDGPPFATGVPHYGHILGSTVKDVIGRYQTMKGYSVPRTWGWDCHGLPIENIVEKDLNISGKKAIEELGIDKFVEHARSKVLTYVGEWEKTVNRIGRWVDFKNSYKTMDNTFIESVWWALGELHKKDLLYEGVRVLAYCPRCETPIANSEIAMDNSYKDITDISVYVKFELKDDPLAGSGQEKTYLLAWTTTPWTLPGNTSIAVNNDIDYIYVTNNGEQGKEILILAKSQFDRLKEKFTSPEILKEVKGSELVGLSYEPVFDYYRGVEMPNKDNIWKVWHADFVTDDQGTGIAHEAPAFGEDDMNLAKDHNIPFIRHVEPNGVFAPEVADFAGIKVKPKEDGQSTDILIIKHLAHKGTLFAKEKIVHSYPHCYRCDTPLLYYALPSWFVNIQKPKPKLLENAEAMNWVPGHLKDGRFKHTMTNAPDWTISRNRYWASPLPFWKSKSGKIMHISSLEDLKSKTKKSGNKYFVMRHGESESNVEKIISSKVDNNDPITEKGIEQVRNQIDNLKSKNIDVVIYSPFMRTKMTAEILKEALSIRNENFSSDERLGEISIGSYNGKTWGEYFHTFNLRDKYHHKPEGGESQSDVKVRITEFLYDIEKKYKDKNILIITHGGPAKFVAWGAEGMRDEDIMTKGNDSLNIGNADFSEISFTPLPHNAHYELDLHRPYIDDIILVDDEGEEYKRIPEVIDCWFESGSMPFAQDHYPFENPDWQKRNFPAGFVAEYIAQTRTWFYYTHVISSILFDQAPFENVVTTGNILAEDGQKMSKSKNNFPDPSLIIDKYGVDPLRFYLMSCPVMKGEDVNFSEKSVQEISNKIVNRLANVVAFYELYRDASLESNEKSIKSSNLLDKWILARFDELREGVSDGMEKYDMVLATKPFESFIEDFSTWYLRRSRERLKDGDKEAKRTMYFIIRNLVRLMAPFTPFSAEDIWLRLRLQTDEESVHLSLWPSFDKSFISKLFSKAKREKSMLDEMRKTREIVTLGLQARQKAGIKVRQPLSQLRIKNYELSEEYVDLIKDEVNVKEVIFDEKQEEQVTLGTEITPELKEEGNYRDLLRAIQDMRKSKGLTPSDEVIFSISTNTEGRELIEKWEEDFKKTVLAKELRFVDDNDGEVISVEELDYKIAIKT